VNKGEAVAVLGASSKEDRYAFHAFEMLREYGHHPIPVNPSYREILGERRYPSIKNVTEEIDTVTLYLAKRRSDSLIDEIVSAKPRRIIMNPGAENPDLARRAEAAGIEVVEACTMVMLRSGLF
jgi:predicted CoA-binding protein